ncbi:hypothetical protein KWG64_04755 [Rahnella sp. PD12R]|uniref:hypothetical protein n=1 Tax=Rahnella sp. PD12R TaxID=2855688 RepID=UPI001C462F6B|nr:hypothetical protein [Rahnella sp. PD12R]MBV6817251.1 hypothetical protein [Rahnella sp. PD12R]
MESPRLFQHALPLAGHVSATPASAANAAAARYFRFGFEPARKKTLAVSHSSLNVVLKAANGYVIRKIHAGWILNLKILQPLSESLPSEVFRDLWLETE